jgi:hypothetical protein
MTDVDNDAPEANGKLKRKEYEGGARAPARRVPQASAVGGAQRFEGLHSL